jgi:S-adenosylmethionine synthetase
MGLLRDVVIGVSGYAIGNAVNHSTAVNTFIDRNFGNKSLEETIDDYAKTRMGVYTQDNRLSKMLHDIARRYEEYNYDSVYGRP